MKPRILAFLGALFLVAWAALPVLAAAPPGKVTIEANGCTFTIHINLDHAYELVGWKVKEYNAANWNDGLTLFKGSGPTDGNGDMTVGPFTAPEGHYNVAVDDEFPPDGSSIVVDFFLSCPAPSAPAGSEAPVSSAEPSAPTGSELPAEGSPPPSGEVLGTTGTPRAMTPPPTDTLPGRQSGGDAWQIAAVIGAVALALALLFPRRVAALRTIADRRRR